MSWSQRLAPILIVQGFLWATFLGFVFGPWEWPMREPWKLFAFVVGCHVALLVGYLSAAHRAPGSGARVDERKLFVWSLAVTALLLPLTSYAKTGQWVPDVLGGLRNPGLAYAEAHAHMENATNFGTYLRILASPLLVALAPLGVFYWSRWSGRLRFGFVAVVLTIALLSVATGQRRDIADLIVVVAMCSMAAHWSGVTRWSRKSLVTGAVACSLVVTAFATYFVVSHVSRVGREAAEYGANPVTRVTPDPDNGLLARVPVDYRPGFLGLMHYFTTGYYGLSLSLDREVQSMYGFGHSMFLTRNFERVTKTPAFEERSLPVQISDNDGFKYPVQWCTAYPYFANDIGFLGTVLLLGLVGRLFAMSWIDALGGSAAGVVMFSLIAILLFYLPATNRMLQDGEGVVAFYVWIGVWLFTRSRVPVARKEAYA